MRLENIALVTCQVLQGNHWESLKHIPNIFQDLIGIGKLQLQSGTRAGPRAS